MSTTDGAVWPDEPVPAGVAPAPRADSGGKESAALRTELDEANERLHRAVAELDNIRKRNARQAEDLRYAARAEAAAAWLPVIDNLERALESGDGADSGVLSGVRAVRDQAVSVLETLGFRRHTELRVPFDPYLHEAIGVKYDVDAEPGTVVEVVRAGYGDGERLLRPAGVVVAGTKG